MFSRKWNFISGNLSLNVLSRDFLNPFLSSFIVILLLSILLYVVADANFKQTQPFRVEGSFVIAAICKDGIIVASDSRGTLKDRQGRRIAYYDVNQKIFPLGDKLIADTGYASLNDAKVSFLSALMSRFSHSPLSRVDVDQLPNSYFKYASIVLAPEGAASARLQTLVFAGYENTRPTICMYDGESRRGIKCRNSGYLSSPHQQILELENVSLLSFQDAARVMKQTIDDYAAAVQPGSVGGPVVIRTITTSGSRWFATPPYWPRWEAFTDLAEDYKNNRIPFHLMPGISKEQLDRVIDDGAAWARLGQTSSARGSTTDGPVIGSYPPDR